MAEKSEKSAEPPSAAGQPTRIGASRGVDELDRRIIRMLQVNGRLSNTEVARALDVTETTVRKRIAHLLDEKLMAIVAVPSPEAAGATLSAIMGVSVDLPAMQAVAAIRAGMAHTVLSLRIVKQQLSSSEQLDKVGRSGPSLARFDDQFTAPFGSVAPVQSESTRHS